MAKKIIFKTSFLVSGIMCFQGCGASIQECFHSCFERCKKEQLISPRAQLIMDAEPQSLGIHRIIISIEDNELDLKQDKHWEDQLHAQFKKDLDATHFELIQSGKTHQTNTSKYTNWINIALNLLSGSTILILSLLIPPSAFLSTGLAVGSFLTTAFTARAYLIPFFQNLGRNTLVQMTSTVTLGWLLSLGHTLYHTITMPLINSFSMIFMSFIMPILLITVINVMDEIKQHILNQSKKMHLKGTKLLFPQMDETYPYYSLSQEEQALLSSLDLDKNSNDFFLLLEKIRTNNAVLIGEKAALQCGMMIQIKKGACFPVDCLLIEENALVDSSLLTGEPQQMKQRGDSIPAGAINLSQSVTVYATKDSYSSTINQLLFRSNRTSAQKISKPNHQFTYIYSALIFIGLGLSLIAPLVLGIGTIPLLLQNITGILFAVCPCTIAIAHELPRLINLHRRAHRGILIREDYLCEEITEPHTILFDKTGTLTTGNSEVVLSENISPALWGRVYLLEKNFGAEHPVAKAIIQYYESKIRQQKLIRNIQNVVFDQEHRGLFGIVQGKKIHIGNIAYLKASGIKVPTLRAETEGFTPIYVAEDSIYKGIIYIKHEIRKNIVEALSRLKQAGKKIIMLTGDSESAARAFNQQNSMLFTPENIYAEQTPQAKEDLIRTLMNTQNRNPGSFWLICDGLNDAPAARMVSEQGGVSCAITPEDKTSFFSNISLNGSLNYLFEHHKLNAFFHKNVLQNQALLIYGALAFIGFIISFSITSIAVSPIIPLIMMTSTTLMILFNSYRVQLQVDKALTPKSSWLKNFLASDGSIALLAGSSLFFICSLLISTISTGGLALPAFVFTAGAAEALSSLCLLTACTLFTLFTSLAGAYLLTDKGVHCEQMKTPDLVQSSSKKNLADKSQDPWGCTRTAAVREWRSSIDQTAPLSNGSGSDSEDAGLTLSI